MFCQLTLYADVFLPVSYSASCHSNKRCTTPATAAEHSRILFLLHIIITKQENLQFETQQAHLTQNWNIVSPLIATLKPQSNGPSYSNTVIGILAVDGRAVTFGTARMGGLLHLVQQGGDWAGPQPAQAPHRCTKCNSPHINGQCTNFVLFDVAFGV